MSEEKKKKAPTTPPDEGEDWLMSYADMMTLIASFFILMMAFANYDPVGFNQKAKEFARNFSGEAKVSEMKMKEIQEEVSTHEIKDRTKISLKDDELIVTFSTSVLYENASPQLESDALDTLDALIDILRTSNNNYRIFVEGHADDDLSNSSFETQWEVSLLRASNIAERFEYFGFDPRNIVPIGRGDNQKINESIVDGKRDQGIANLNRRVVIRVLEPHKKEKMKMGLGVYFRDATEEVQEEGIDESVRKEFDVE